MRKILLILTVLFGLFSGGCMFNPAKVQELNVKFQENSVNLNSNVARMVELAESGTDLYFNLQIAMARREVRDQFRGAYRGAAGEQPAKIRDGKVTQAFRHRNADLDVDYLLEAEYFARKFEMPDAFAVTTNGSTNKYDFLQFHAKRLKGEIGALGGSTLVDYEKTLGQYYRFLDRFEPARGFVARETEYTAAFGRFVEVLDAQLKNNERLLQGYQSVASMKDPFTEIVTALPLSKEDKKVVLDVARDTADSGVLGILRNKIEE